MKNKNIPDNKDKLQIHLEEQFQNLKGKGKLPEEVKKDVFNTLDTLNLIADITDLFTVKFTKTESEFLDLLSENNEDDLDKNK